MSNQAKKIIHVIVRAVIIKNGQLLVCVGQKNQYTFLPGGHIEPQEAAIIALERELREELGLRAKVKRFLGCFEYQYEGLIKTKIYDTVIIRTKPLCHTHEINLIFEVDVPGLVVDSIPQSPENHTSFLWVPLNAHEKEIKLLPYDLLVYISEWLNCDFNVAFKSRMK